jgi:hypothetical protein
MGFYPVGLVGAAALSNPVTIGQGGSGKTTAAAAFNALNPNAAPAQSSPGNPTATASTTPVMMGLAVAYTPASSGLVQVIITGLYTCLTSSANMTIGGRYGTGGAPINGAATTGTSWGTGTGDYLVRESALSGTGALPFALTGLLTLTPATAYWFDLALSTTNAADSAEVLNLSVSIAELPAG